MGQYLLEVAPPYSIDQLAVCNSVLYGAWAGANFVYRYDNGMWQRISAPTSIASIIAFNGSLYCSTWVTGRLYRLDGTTFVQVAPQLVATRIACQAEFNGKLYGGTGDGRLYEWNGVNAWAEVAPPTVAGLVIMQLVVCGGKLYGVDINQNLYEWNTNVWTLVATGSGGTTYSLANFNGALFSANITGQLFRWNGVDAWTQVVNNASIIMYRLIVFNNGLYGGGGVNGATPYVALVRWDNQGSWISEATSTTHVYTELRQPLYIRSMAIFDGTLYCGTWTSSVGSDNGILLKFVVTTDVVEGSSLPSTTTSVVANNSTRVRTIRHISGLT